MSDTEVKEYRSKRLFKDQVKAKKQKNILKAHHVDIDPFLSENYFAKKHAMNCGNSNCVMCGNPRKFFGEKTIQEERFDEICADYKNESGQDGNALDC